MKKIWVLKGKLTPVGKKTTKTPLLIRWAPVLVYLTNREIFRWHLCIWPEHSVWFSVEITWASPRFCMLINDVIAWSEISITTPQKMIPNFIPVSSASNCFFFFVLPIVVWKRNLVATGHVTTYDTNFSTGVESTNNFCSSQLKRKKEKRPAATSGFLPTIKGAL